MIRTFTASIFLGFSASFAFGHGPHSAPNYHEVARFAVGGEGGWDYLIVGPQHHVFISRGTHTIVVDGDSGSVLGDIPDTSGVHGIAFSTAMNRGFTSNGRDNSVTEFDLTTFKTIKKIPVTGTNPDCIIFDPKTKRVFTFNGRSGDVSAIDPRQEKEIGKVTLGGKLEFAASDHEGHIFCNNESANEVDEFDAASLQVLKKWSISPAEGPSGLAIDLKNHRLFSVTDGKMVISDAIAGKVVTTVDIGEGPDAAAFDPSLGLAFSSNGESGTLSVVKELSPSEFKLVQTVTTQQGARTMALDAATHKIYLVTARESFIRRQPEPAVNAPKWNRILSRLSSLPPEVNQSPTSSRWSVFPTTLSRWPL